MLKKSYPVIYLNGENLYTSGDKKVNTTDAIINPVDYVVNLSHKGAKKIVIVDISSDDKSHETTLTCLRNITRAVDIPIIGTGNIKRLEDVKKIIYSGCKKCALDMSINSNVSLIKEASERFEKDRIVALVNNLTEFKDNFSLINEYACEVVSSDADLVINDNDVEFSLLESDAKKQVYAPEINCRYSWSDFKLNSDGMIPVIVQDYKTDEVLMVAYMNEDAFNETIKTGMMTYYSRSRNELWVKGLTSGHFQYVKSMYLDCDFDTVLVKVAQVGSACHTGKGSCFFNEAFSLNTTNHNPSKIFDEVMATITDRKENPKEGSYTNYLFDKGIDKILKKVGEEATEIVIAAKNPDKEEIKYEIADFLYHVMVLMAQKEVTWDDIMEELANR